MVNHEKMRFTASLHVTEVKGLFADVSVPDALILYGTSYTNDIKVYQSWFR